jgi:hypothetical protein
LVNTGFRRSAVVAAISSLRQTDRQTDRSSLVFRRIFRPLSSSCSTKRSTDAVKSPGRNKSFSFSKTLYLNKSVKWISGQKPRFTKQLQVLSNN